MAVINREDWLLQATHQLKIWFKQNGYKVGNPYISVGWPSSGSKLTTIGETFGSGLSKDGKNHIYISPTVSKPNELLAVITHELCHVVDDCRSLHGVPFQLIASTVGLKAPWTQSVATPELNKRFKAIKEKLGKYPHSACVVPSDRTTHQKSYMLRSECKNDGYLIRITKKWADQGLPICPLCGSTMRLTS